MSKNDAVSVEIVKVTRAQARKWLENNEVNRRVRPKLVAAYRRDMEHGRWAFTAEPIQISRTGRLMNGQHRLSALAGSDVPSLEFLVATGLPDETQKLMDQGASRGLVDALLMQEGHVKNVALVASMGRWLTIHPVVGPQFSSNSLRTKVTAAEVLETYRSNEDLQIAGERATAMRPYLSGSPSAIGYSWLQMNRVDSQACTEYWAGLTDMEWQWKHDPRKAALRRIQAIHRDPDVKTSLETAVMMVSVFTRSWNAWRKNEDMESIMARSRQGAVAPVKLI